MVVNVLVTVVNQQEGCISRHELLAWVNDALQANFVKIEEMATAEAYCQFTDLLFPGKILMKKVKWNSRHDVDWLSNWQQLQLSWKNIGVDKPVPVERLVRAKFQDNFEFLQWFKRFFDANYDGRAYDAIAARGGVNLPASSAGKPGVAAPAVRSSAAAAPPARVPQKPAPTPAPTTNSRATAAAPAAARSTAAAKTSATAPAAQKPKATPPPPTNNGNHQNSNGNSNGAAAAVAAAQAAAAAASTTIAKLEEKTAEQERLIEELARERDFYFGKLRQIEQLVQEAPDGILPVPKVEAVLYEESGASAAAGVDDPQEIAAEQPSSASLNDQAFATAQQNQENDSNLVPELNAQDSNNLLLLDEDHHALPEQPTSNGLAHHEEDDLLLADNHHHHVPAANQNHHNNQQNLDETFILGDAQAAAPSPPVVVEQQQYQNANVVNPVPTAVGSAAAPIVLDDDETF